MLDKLPVKLRNAVQDGATVFLGAYLAFFLKAVLVSGGVTGLDYSVVPVESLDGAAVATAGYLLVAYITPLTKRFGVGSEKPPEAL